MEQVRDAGDLVQRWGLVMGTDLEVEPRGLADGTGCGDRGQRKIKGISPRYEVQDPWAGGRTTNEVRQTGV